MISEKLFSKSYSTFWSEVTPWLNSYTQLINKRYLSKPFSSLTEIEDSKFRSINGILSFNYYKTWVLSSKPKIADILKASRAEIKRFPRNHLSEYRINTTNTKIIESLAKRLRATYDEDLFFNPAFQGCGILANCEGDLLSKDALIEVKTGERQIAPSDIRQLLVYVGLNQISGGLYKINEVQYFNPRKGVLWRSRLDDLFRSISTIPVSDFSYELASFLILQSDEFTFD